ncbi:ROK family protein [Shouchella shacheensis]|uniref:ROK family protein n=1 Tax=Shouchella shacheensis TaxID=1649580 RepID=UPI00073FB659|nr:ROK family protein [Shouchella shacheensis]
MLYGAFDVGGTSIKYGVVDEQGSIVFKSHMATETRAGGPAVVKQIKTVTTALKDMYALTGIAISTAGQIDNREGKVVHATESIPGYTGLPIKRELEKACQLPVVVDNDVNCAALGEYWKGAAQGTENFLCMTLGTGIGGSIVDVGEIYTGASFSAGEFGHMTLYPNGKSCPCGDKGCYEMYASSRALEERAQEYWKRGVSLPKLFEEARNGEKTAELMIDRWVSDVALGIKTLVHVFNPPLLVIGGGVSAQGDFLLNKVKKQVFAHIMPSFQRSLQLKMAENGNEANLQGAVFQWIAANGSERSF